MTQVTDVATGVSGLTATSPALSVARTSGDVAFSVYVNGRHEIRLTAAAQAGGQPVAGPVASVAATLPPVPRPNGHVVRLLGTPTLERASAEPFPIEDYTTDLSLDYIGQPYVVAGADRFGALAGGGISFVFSDMLGEHTVGTTLQIQGSFDQFGGQIGYMNRTSRWNWGVSGSQTPFITGGVRSGVALVDGQPAFVREQIEFQQTHRQVNAVVAYPFNRSMRVELAPGFRQIGFDQTIRSEALSLATGALIAEDERELAGPASLRFGEVAAALVGDTAIAGPTGPLTGQRYRFELAPTVGSLRFTTALADYRRYIMPARPFTIAARLLHVGRYGGDADDDRLFPMFLGYPTLVRGYEAGSFTSDECAPRGDDPCPALNRLTGSRMMVANLELRFPLVGVFTGDLDYGPLPADVVIFGDGGIAWTADDQRDLARLSRRFVTSVGAGLRVNAFGYAIVELDLVRPLDRPGKNWMFAFNVRPGF